MILVFTSLKRMSGQYLISFASRLTSSTRIRDRQKLRKFVYDRNLVSAVVARGEWRVSSEKLNLLTGER